MEVNSVTPDDQDPDTAWMAAPEQPGMLSKVLDFARERHAMLYVIPTGEESAKVYMLLEHQGFDLADIKALLRDAASSNVSIVPFILDTRTGCTLILPPSAVH